MKQLILSVVILFGVLSTQAQTTRNQKAKTIKTKKTSSTTGIRKVDTTNNRVIYKSKRTGQAATITGQQATGTNGQQSANPKNAGKREE